MPFCILYAEANTHSLITPSCYLLYQAGYTIYSLKFKFIFHSYIVYSFERFNDSDIV